MNTSNDSEYDDLQDRLMDQALREALGGETPPDLSAQILAAVEKQNPKVSPQQKEPVMEKSKRRYWIGGAVAACLVAGVTALLLPAVQQSRESARRAQVAYDLKDTQLREELGSQEGLQQTPQASVTNEPFASRYDRQKEVVDTLHDVEQSLVPFSGEAPVVYPDAEVWEELTQGRRENREGEPKVPMVHERRPAAVPPMSTLEDTSSERKLDRLPAARIVLKGRPEDAAVVGKRIHEAETLPAPYYMQDDVKYRGQVVASQSFMSDESFARRDKDAMLSVTPRIVIQEEEEAKLEGYYGTNPSGIGPGRPGDQYVRIVENAFQAVKDHPLSTFSIDVDTASYANVRRFLLQDGMLPPPDAVRIEELINYFDYDYAGPKDDVPFAAHLEVAECPWAEGHRLVRVGLKGKEIAGDDRPECNLVFLLDVSGSMDSPDKLPLVKSGMRLLAEKLRPNDRVAIVVYAGSEGLVLPLTRGNERRTILTALEKLQAGGSTNGGAGIELAYRIAKDNFITGGVNRVILATDGDFNVGTTSTGDLVRMVEEKAKSGVFLSVLGFGRGNLNDAMMEDLSNKGNGNYAYVDGLTEAQKVLVQQLGGTLVTIAKDVKIQIEFNPAQVAAYRLLGYENRMLAAEDFNDDKKDAGEIGAGHTVTALYELVPAGQKVDTSPVDPLKYQPAVEAVEETQEEPATGELLTLKLRYKQPDGDVSKKLEFPVTDAGQRFGQAGGDFQFAAAVAAFGMLLRGSEHSGTANYDAVLEMATAAKGTDVHGYRAEFLDMVRRAQTLAGK